MTARKHLLFLTLALALPASQLSAQFGGGNPMEEIKEIADAVDKQLKEIDRLLLESGKKGQARSGPKEMLEQAAESSRIAEDGIDKLIEKLSEMSQQSSSSSSSSSSSQQQDQQQQQQQQSGQQQGQQQNRRENQTPDFVQQPQQGQEQQGQEQQGQEQQGQEQQGQQQQQQGQQEQQGQDGQPRGGQEQRTGGENRRGNRAADDATDAGKPGTGSSEWGGLQPYLNFLKNRGSTPKVPEKFRRYYEAYLKNKSKGGKQ